MDEIGRGRSAIPSRIQALVWKKRFFLVDEIARGSSAIPIMTLALLKTPWRIKYDYGLSLKTPPHSQHSSGIVLVPAALSKKI